MLFLLYLFFFMAPTKSNKFAVCKYAEALDYDKTRSKNLINATTKNPKFPTTKVTKQKKKNKSKVTLEL